jgi:hypothetical protein
MSVTKIEDIKNKFESEVEISGFNEGETITLKLRHISILELISKGTIPNQLMNSVVGLFEGNKSKKKAKDEDADYAEVNKMIELVCENIIVEPSYKELKPYLTDQQKLEIFYYSQGGVKEIERFRKATGNTEYNNNGKDL